MLQYLPVFSRWIARARVPMPSTKDYITRPQWQTDVEVGKSKKKEVTIEQISRNYLESLM